jgi:hypothetical protein
VEFFVVIAVCLLIFMVWQIIRAKRFTQFKRVLSNDIKPKVISHIIAELNDSRSDILPNNEIHCQATIDFWGQYPVRILQAALHRNIIDKAWLEKTGNMRNSQHLFFIERDKMARCSPE